MKNSKSYLKVELKNNSNYNACILIKSFLIIFPADHTDFPDIIFKREDNLKNAFYIKDAVDDVIEKVLSSGGDVEFVDEGILNNYDKIVLLEYY